MSENAIPGCFDSRNPVAGILHRSYDLLKKAGNVSGPWRDIAALGPMTVHVYGDLGGGQVQLYVSNDPDPESSQDAGIALGAAIDEAGMTSITGPYRWMRAVSSGATLGSINVALHGKG